MNMHEYLDTVTGQIRCRQARPMVEEEMKGHIEDQAEVYMQEGMPEQEALEKAVREMGDPVEAGTLLDRVHRPKMEWSVLGLVGILSITGLVIQYLFTYQCGGDYSVNYFLKQLGYVLIGFLCMLAVYRTDYTLLAKWAVVLWAGLLLAAILIYGIGGSGPLSYGQARLALYAVTMLYIPVYAGVLFHFRGGGYLQVFYCVAMMLLFSWVARFSGAALLQTFFISIILLCAAVCRNWYHINRRAVLAGILGGLVVLPFIVLYGIAYFGLETGLLAEYQMARLRLMMGITPMPGYQEFNHLRQSLLQNCRLTGQTELSGGNILPNMQNDYVITGLFAYYGIIAGLLLLALIVFFLARIFRVVWKQQNQLGHMTGLSCALLFASQSAIYIHSNLWGGFIGQMSMPFLSYGFVCTAVNFILSGIFLSVYRGSMITDERRIRKNDGWKIKFVREE